MDTGSHTCAPSSAARSNSRKPSNTSSDEFYHALHVCIYMLLGLASADFLQKMTGNGLLEVVPMEAAVPIDWPYKIILCASKRAQQGTQSK